MNLETHHRGRSITLKTLSSPEQMGTALIVVEDGIGNFCVVAQLVHCLSVEVPGPSWTSATGFDGLI